MILAVVQGSLYLSYFVTPKLKRQFIFNIEICIMRELNYYKRKNVFLNSVMKGGLDILSISGNSSEKIVLYAKKKTARLYSLGFFSVTKEEFRKERGT